jgi:hypothetical protein
MKTLINSGVESFDGGTRNTHSFMKTLTYSIGLRAICFGSRMIDVRQCSDIVDKRDFQVCHNIPCSLSLPNY